MKMSAKQAEALGIIPPKKKRQTRKVASGPYYTRCTTCDTEFHTQAAEDRHVEATKHTRYQLVLMVD